MEYDVLVRLNEVGCRCVPRAVCLGTFVDPAGLAHHVIVEEHVRGMALDQVVREGVLTGDAKVVALAFDQVVAVTLAVARAVESMSRAGIAHRDISPSNVMLTSACLKDGLGAGAEVVLVDYTQSTATARRDVTLEMPLLATIPYGARDIRWGILRQ